MFRKPQRSAPYQPSNRRRSQHRPALRLSDYITVASKQPTKNSVARSIGKSLKHRVPQRMRSDGKHVGQYRGLFFRERRY